MIYDAPFNNDLTIDMPFKSYFNFSSLLEFFQNEGKTKGYNKLPVFQEKMRFLAKAAPLYQTIEDMSVMEEYKEQLAFLLEPMFPSLLQTNEIKTLALPYCDKYVNPTYRLRGIMQNSKKKGFHMRAPKADFFYVQACLFIMAFYYGKATKMTRPFFLDVENKNGRKSIYRTFLNADYCEFRPVKGYKELNEAELEELLMNPENIDLWKEKFPVDSFIMEGFTVVSMYNVTADESQDQLKSFLLKRNALSDVNSRKLIKDAIGTLLDSTNFKVGLTHYDQTTNQLSQHNGEGWKSYSVSGNNKVLMDESYCSISSSILLSGQNNYVSWQHKQGLMDESPKAPRYLVGKGYKSMIFIPLVYGNEVIGILELVSKDEDLITPLSFTMVEAILPMLTMALYSHKENQQTQFEAIIQQQYTSLHSSIAWRFFEAAEEHLLQDEFKEVPISFPNVYPLFGQSDIMSSSTIRNSAIQSDLLAQFKAAKIVLQTGMQIKSVPIFRQLKHELDKHLKYLNKELSAGDELALMDFVNNKLEPVFSWMRTENEYKESMRPYDSLLDKDLGIVYDKRGQFETSVSMINENLSSYFMDRQKEAQKVFPHYCEFYKTDGVEYNLYIGQSIQPGLNFQEFHLKNLRLWQLMTSCEQENLFQDLRSKLPLDLKVRTLILCHDNPMSIKFRIDEKKFDVDGAYNIRYEIVKKRIDKAIVKGTGERLTKTDHITVVFSQEKEKFEYLEYFTYLESIKYLKKGIEILDLEDMPGAAGLQALRSEVNFKSLVTEMPQSKKFLSKVGSV